MASGTIAPQFWFQALDDTGIALPGALIHFYVTGTTTRTPAYADGALSVPLTNPAACDAAGRLVMYLSPAVLYKIVVTTAAGVTVRTVDPVTPTGASASGVGSSLGEVFVFGGDQAVGVATASYPTGATFDKLHAGTGVYPLNSASLMAGTYILQGCAKSLPDGTATVGLVNLTDGAPNTPLAEYTVASDTGAIGSSGAITFAAAGATKQYGIKVHTSGGSVTAFSWGIRIMRV